MKLDGLRKLVKEELNKVLNENQPKYKKGDTFLYMGTKHEVISDDGFVVKAKLPNGKVKTLNYSQLKSQLNESPYPLIPKKMFIADVLELNDIPDEEFAPQDKNKAVYFIRNGRPSEVYLEGILDILKNYKIDTSEIEAGPEKTSSPTVRPSKEINPYEMPGGEPMRRPLGGGFSTGD